MQNLEIIGVLALSWLLVWRYEKGNLSVLGLKLTPYRLKYACLLFVVTAACCSTGFLMRIYFADEQMALNPDTSMSLVLKGIWLNFESVLFEELLCRGVALYLLIKMLGQKWAILISAIAFGLLHVFNAGALSNVFTMIFVFGNTFLMGLLLAYAFAKSYSLYWPFAIHFGWNLTQNFIFPDGPFGNQLLLTTLQPEVTVSYSVYYSMILFPKASALLADYLLIKRNA